MMHLFPRLNRLHCGAALITTMLLAPHADAAVVTLWEEQFTGVSTDWTDDGTDVAVTHNAYASASDGSEAIFTATTTAANYIVYSIPEADVNTLQAGDTIEISARSAWPTGVAIYLELVDDLGGTAALIPWGFHDENGNGTGYTTRSATLTSVPRSSGNLWIGIRDNDGSDGFGFGGVDYIRITGERAVPEPTMLSLGCATLVPLLLRRRR